MSSPSPSTSAATSSGSGESFKERMAARKAKLETLNRARNQSRSLNLKEVAEEDRRNKEPKNMEARKRRAEYILKEEAFKKKCEEEGKDFQREMMRNVGADEAEASDRRRRAKDNRDQGFSSFEEASARKYNQLVKSIKPDFERVNAAKEKAGDAWYAEVGTVVHGVHTDSKAAIDKMANDVKAQVEKREKFSRRRRHDDDADIDYINERNMKFNQKLERFYGNYTQDIKDNLERGTAV